MGAVTELAEVYGWQWAHFRPAKTSKGWRTPVSGSLGKGWPDLVLARERDGRLLFIELKSAKGSPTPEQDHVARVLGTAGRYFLWRPRHLDSGEIAAILQ